MKRILIAMLLLACMVAIQGRAVAQLAVVQNSGTTWMAGDDGGGTADPNQPAPDDGGGGDE